MPTTSTFSVALRAQPTGLRRAREEIALALDRSTIAAWSASDTIVVVAMGASSHSAHALVAALAEHGRRAVNISASELAHASPGFQPGDHYLVVSESGRSPETLSAASSLTIGRRIGISNHPEAQIAGVVDLTIGLGGLEDSPVYTVGYTATLLAYAMLLDHVGAVPEAYDLVGAPDIVERLLIDFSDLAGSAGDIFASARSIDVIGSGASFASASEAALMVREALRTTSASFETMQYLHGPMEPMGSGHVLLVFGDGRELTVPDSVLDSGARVVLVTSASPADIPSAGHPGLTIVRIDGRHSLFVRAIVEIVFVQMAIDRAAEAKPFDLETFLFEQIDTKLPEVV